MTDISHRTTILITSSKRKLIRKRISSALVKLLPSDHPLFVRPTERNFSLGREAGTEAASTSVPGPSTNAPRGKKRDGSNKSTPKRKPFPNKRCKSEKGTSSSDSEDDCDDSDSSSSSASTNAPLPIRPNKFLTAFQFFEIDQPGSRGTKRTAKVRGAIAKEMWKRADPDIRAKYEQWAKLDKERYNKQLAEYKKLRKTHGDRVIESAKKY